VKNREVMGAGGYEIFRNIVDCAHLRPLDQGEGVTFMENQTNKIGAARISFRELQYRNSAAASLARGGAAAGVAGAAAADASAAEDSARAVPAVLPENVDTAPKFARAWRRDFKTPTARWELLRELDPHAVYGLFAKEIDASLLCEMLAAMHACAEALESYPEQGRAMLLLLRVLSDCGRFSLAIQFFGKKEKLLTVELFDALAKCAGGGGEFAEADVAAVRDVYMPE
jgi:hypothetical protein